MYKHKVLIPEEKIQQRIAAIASSLNRDYDGHIIDVICILKGGLIFMSDLIRSLTIPVRLHFVQVSSYGDETESSGTVNLHFSSVSEDLTGKDVLLVEDVLDTGITLDYLMKQLKEEKPASLKTCVLLDKPSRRKLNINADYVGFEIPDNFVIGYGLDYRELGRNLRYIAELDPSECR
jgi:hypoxanthine phosphoribosyltransferase